MMPKQKRISLANIFIKLKLIESTEGRDKKDIEKVKKKTMYMSSFMGILMLIYSIISFINNRKLFGLFCIGIAVINVISVVGLRKNKNKLE
jgi:hypothetical protein